MARLDLLTLRLFVAVYEEASLTRAAERENISLSALSKRLSDLEKSLNTVLFNRTRNRLDPTLAASTLAYHVRRILSDLDQLSDELTSFSRGLKGRIRIWSNAWAIIHYLPKELASFMSAHPLLQIELQESVTPAIIEAVAENAADIGIIAGNAAAAGLQVLPYRTDRLVAVMAKDHPLGARPAVTFADMTEYDVIGPRLGSAIDTLFNNAAFDFDFAWKPRIRVAGIEAVCCMAETRLGVGLVPEKAVKRYLDTLAITTRPLDEPWAERRLNLCIASPETLTPAGRLLLAHLTPGLAVA